MYHHFKYVVKSFKVDLSVLVGGYLGAEYALETFALRQV